MFGAGTSLALLRLAPSEMRHAFTPSSTSSQCMQPTRRSASNSRRPSDATHGAAGHAQTASPPCGTRRRPLSHATNRGACGQSQRPRVSETGPESSQKDKQSSRARPPPGARVTASLRLRPAPTKTLQSRTAGRVVSGRPPGRRGRRGRRWRYAGPFDSQGRRRLQLPSQLALLHVLGSQRRRRLEAGPPARSSRLGQM